MKHRQAQAGFSLVELMIALVVGLLLIAGMTTVMSGNIQTSTLSQTSAALQSSGRFSLGLISSDIRSAGFRGCSTGISAVNNTTDKISADILTSASITGATIGEDSWDDLLPDTYTAPTGRGKPVADTQALLVRYALAPGHQVTQSMTSTNDTILFASSSPSIYNGDLALITDCQSTDLLEVSTVTSASGVATLTPADALTRAYSVSTEYPTSLRAMRIVNTLYYIGETGRTTATGEKVLALFEQAFPFDPANNPPAEIGEGVEQMQLRFGLRAADGSTQYVGIDDAAFDATRIRTVQAALLIASTTSVLDAPAARAFDLSGQLIHPSTNAPAGSLTYVNDKRLRMVFSTTISVRNRGL